MRLQKIEENEEVQRHCFLDYINCGWCYLLTNWDNETKTTVTLNKDTVLEDLHEKHGGSINYSKLCGETFRLYKSMSEDSFDGDLDKVLSWTMIDPHQWWPTSLLKALITGSEDLRTSGSCIVRWPNEGGRRGTDWYRVIET